jgi:hypothetical protein
LRPSESGAPFERQPRSAFRRFRTGRYASSTLPGLLLLF